MKNGLLFYKSYNGEFNIGDYIQSIAARQFMPSIDQLLNREELNNYSGDNIKLILNGWFLHEPNNWPPSESIEPLFVSFHLNSIAYEILEKSEVIEYFKKHQPIGCRDNDTVKIFKSKGIDAYFTGCLTLTLSKSIKGKSKRKGIYFVDLPYQVSRNIKDVLNYIKIFIRKTKIIFEINSRKFNHVSMKNIVRTIAFYESYSGLFSDEILGKAQFIKHVIKEMTYKNEHDKFAHAEDLLYKYANSELVVTSRIHCLLPSLSFDTPVIYINSVNVNISSECRFSGLVELFPTIVDYFDGHLKNRDSLYIKSISEIISLPISNIAALKNDLINRVTKFVNV